MSFISMVMELEPAGGRFALCIVFSFLIAH